MGPENCYEISIADSGLFFDVVLHRGVPMLYIIQNDPEVPLGNYADALVSFSILYKIIPAFNGEPLPMFTECTALIVLGGGMNVDDTDGYPFLLQVKEMIRSVLATGIPYLGICLGGQLLAEVAGGRVINNRWEEIGTLPVQLNNLGALSPLFAGITSKFPTFQWHHDSFDIPPGGSLLAFSPACPNQAFSLGETAYGLQFHPEMLESVIANWCCWTPVTAAETDRHLAEFAAAKAAYQAASWLILENFLRIAGLR